LDLGGVKVVLLVHYFGFPQPQLVEIRSLCDRYSVLLVEDCAQCSCGGDLAGGIGQVGTYSFFSVHKTLPTKGGGVLQVNDSSAVIPTIRRHERISIEDLTQLCNADWREIAKRRVANYLHLGEALSGEAAVDLMYPCLPKGVVPLNLPVILRGVDRFTVYRRMREDGIGVVALYHHLVEEISESAFPKSHTISQHILNLPIHQELGREQMIGIAGGLKAVIQAERG
jgi:dTDP-4-amino-4,6-dideoxygalactose transaminase